MPRLRQAAQREADAAYEAQRRASEIAYQNAIAAAADDFQEAVDNLPADEQATYTLRDFAWPTAPNDNALVIPLDSDQEALPVTAPTYDGAAFDYTLDQGYRAAVAQAEKEYSAAIHNAEEQYRQDVQNADDSYRGDVENAQGAYSHQVNSAYDAYDQALQNNPDFDDEQYQSLVDAVQEAWEDYRQAVAQHQKDHNQIVTDADHRETADLEGTGQDEEDAVAAAYVRIFDFSRVKPDEGEEVPDDVPTPVQVSDHWEDQYHYQRGEGDDIRFDQTRWNDSPDKWTDWEHAKYEIDKEFARKYADILNEHDRTVADADRDETQADAQSLHDALVAVYAAQRDMAEMSRDFQHDQIADQLADEYALTAALAAAQAQLSQDLADAQANHDKAVADAAQGQDYDIADAHRTYTQGLSTARLAATLAWKSQTASSGNSQAIAWANYRYHLAGIENDYLQDLAEAAHVRDFSKADAAQVEAYGIADAEAAKAGTIATAEETRTTDLAAKLRDFRTNVDDKYTTRDDSLTDAWYTRRVAIADAAETFTFDTADINYQYNVADDEANNNFYTAMVGGPGSPVQYSGWVYNVYNYHWYGDDATIDILNAHSGPDDDPNAILTEDELRYTRDEVLAVNERDHSLALEDAAETFDHARIDAFTAYREQTNQDFHDAAYDVAGLNADYQIDVAKEQDAYNESVAEAAADFAVDVATAEAGRKFSDLEADAQYTLDEAPLSSTRSIDEAQAKKDFQVAEAGDFYDALEDWAAGETPWENYQLRVAGAELTRLTSLGDAEIARATSLAEVNEAWTEATVTADGNYAAALYGGEEGGGAYVDRVSAIAAAHVALVTGDEGEDGPITKYVRAQAEATREHDQDMADANLDFYNQLAEIDAERNHTVAQAVHENARDHIRNEFDRTEPSQNGPISAEEQADRDAQAANRNAQSDRRRLETVVYANADRSNGSAEARRDWVESAGEINVTYVTALVAAQGDRADEVRDEIISLATAVAYAQADFESADAAAQAAQTVAVAEADATYSNAAAVIEATYAKAAGDASSEKSSADAGALGDYEVGLYTDHVTAATAYYNSHTSSALALYQKAVAIADKNWAIAQADARDSYYNDEEIGLTVIEAAHTQAVNDADVAAARRTAAANLAFATAQAATDDTLSESLANADAALYIGQKTAEAQLIVDGANPQGDADIAYAQAVADRDNAYAEAMVEWVAAVTAAEVDLQLDNIDDTQFSDIVQEATDSRQEAHDAADDAFDAATADTSSDEEQELGQARIDYVDTYTQARIDHAGDTGSALATHASDSATHDAQLTALLSYSDQTHQNELLAADYQHTLDLATLNIAYQAALADASTDRATDRAVAEAVYETTTSEADYTRLQTLADADPDNEQLAFEAAQADAFAQWIAALTDGGASSNYVTFITAQSAADGASQVDLAIAQANEDAAQALASYNYASGSGR